MRTKESRFKRVIAIRLEKGDEVIENLLKACSEHGVKNGTVFGLGALSSCVLYASASAEKLEPNALELKGPLEVAGATGDITLKDGKPHIHLHVVLGRADHLAVAGHLKQGVVSLTGEFFIFEFAGEVERKRDESLAMDLMNL